MTGPVIVPNPETVRGPIEQTHNKTRDDREQQYVTDRLALDTDYHSDLHDIQVAKEAALVAAHLNPDGSVPTHYGWGAPPDVDVEGTPGTPESLSAMSADEESADTEEAPKKPAKKSTKK